LIGTQISDRFFVTVDVKVNLTCSCSTNYSTAHLETPPKILGCSEYLNGYENNQDNR